MRHRPARPDRPGAVPAEVLDQRPVAACGCRGARRRRLRHQSGAGHPHDHRCPRRRHTGTMGGRRRGIRRRSGTARHTAPMAMRLRAWHRRQPCVVTAAGAQRVDVLAASLPRAWQRLSAGIGAKRQRWYSWAIIEIIDDSPGHHHLLIRRKDKTGELADYRCYGPEPATLNQYVRVAGYGGRSSNHSKPARAWPDSTNTRYGAGPPGIAGSPSRCSRTRSWSSPRLPNAPTTPPTTH
jgi:hypothetical protein